jgi:hypothetical protein
MKRTWWAVALSLGLAAAGAAQDRPSAERPQGDPPEKSDRAETPDLRPGEMGRRGRTLVPLKVQVVLTRHQGEKRVASLPYTMSVTAGGIPARLRMGVQVPVSTKMVDTPNAPSSWQYRDVGVNIDCSAEAIEGGRFSVSLTLEQTAVYVAGDKPEASWQSLPVGTQPMFRTFNARFNPILRDGQSQQFTLATDPVSGEVIKVEVALAAVR